MRTVLVYDTPAAAADLYALSLHDALPICTLLAVQADGSEVTTVEGLGDLENLHPVRSEEHTSELQSRPHLVCRLLLEKKNACLFAHALAHACRAVPPAAHPPGGVAVRRRG